MTTTAIPIAMNTNASLLSTKLMALSMIGNPTRKDPKTNASFTRDCSYYPTFY